MNEIIVLADLGHFRVYRVSKGAMDRTKIELIVSFDNIEAHGRWEINFLMERGSSAWMAAEKSVVPAPESRIILK